MSVYTIHVHVHLHVTCMYHPLSPLQDRTKMLFGKDVEVGHDVIKRKRDEFMINRGKKTTDRTQTIDNLRLLLQVSRHSGMGVGLELLLLKDIIETTFDISGVTSCMKTDVWET